MRCIKNVRDYEQDVWPCSFFMYIFNKNVNNINKEVNKRKELKMDKIERMAVYKGKNYYRVDDLTNAVGIGGRNYQFNAALEAAHAKIVKIPGFGNSYFISESDAINMEKNIHSFDDVGNRIDAGTGQMVTKADMK